MPFLLWFVNALRGENKIKNMSAIFLKKYVSQLHFNQEKNRTFFTSNKQTNRHTFKRPIWFHR